MLTAIADEANRPKALFEVSIAVQISNIAVHIS